MVYLIYQKITKYFKGTNHVKNPFLTLKTLVFTVVQARHDVSLINWLRHWGFPNVSVSKKRNLFWVFTKVWHISDHPSHYVSCWPELEHISENIRIPTHSEMVVPEYLHIDEKCAPQYLLVESAKKGVHDLQPVNPCLSTILTRVIMLQKIPFNGTTIWDNSIAESVCCMTWMLFLYP